MGNTTAKADDIKVVETKALIARLMGEGLVDEARIVYERALKEKILAPEAQTPERIAITEQRDSLDSISQLLERGLYLKASRVFKAATLKGSLSYYNSITIFAFLRFGQIGKFGEQAITPADYDRVQFLNDVLEVLGRAKLTDSNLKFFREAFSEFMTDYDPELRKKVEATLFVRCGGLFNH